MIRVVRVIALIVVVVAMSSQTLLACPSCSDNFTKGSANASLGEAYSWSVLFMLAVPLFIVTTFVLMMWKRHRVHSGA